MSRRYFSSTSEGIMPTIRKTEQVFDTAFNTDEEAREQIDNALEILRRIYREHEDLREHIENSVKVEALIR